MINGINKKQARIITFGCQMNVHDAEKIKAMLIGMGYAVSDAAAPDLAVAVTCCVRKSAEDRAIGHIGDLKHVKTANPNAVIAVCGCMTQQKAMVQKLTESYKHVDIIFGTFNIPRFPELLREYEQTRRTVVDIRDSHDSEEAELPAARGNPYKAYVSIMYGCDNFCSYCIVPYVRGRERSRPHADIIKEAEALAADGVREITLLGQNVNSYGRGADGGITFAELLRRIDSTANECGSSLQRLRFVTSHPKDLSDDLIAAMRDCKTVCPHLHLPAQSGSTRVLGLMNRGYTKEDYLNLVEKIRRAVPDITLTTDIIVGFPGETEEDFAETLDMIEKARFGQVFTFIYAKRAGTPAADMPQNASERDIKNRFGRLQERVNAIAYELNAARTGAAVPVLVEGIDEKTGLYYGRTPGNMLTHISFKADNPPPLGETVPIRITGAKTFFLSGCYGTPDTYKDRDSRS